MLILLRADCRYVTPLDKASGGDERGYAALRTCPPMPLAVYAAAGDCAMHAEAAVATRQRCYVDMLRHADTLRFFHADAAFRAAALSAILSPPCRRLHHAI